MLSEPLLEAIKISLTLVADTLLVVLGVEDKGWISSDLNVLSLVCGGIELANYEVLVVFEVLTELIPNWSKLLAMTAPWGIVLNENILGWVHDNLFELRAYNYGNTAIVILWNWLRLEVGLERSVFNGINPSSNIIRSDLIGEAVEVVLGHLVGEDGSQGGKVSIGDSHEVGELTLDVVALVREREEHLAFMGNGSSFEFLGEGLIFLVLLSEEDQGVLLLSKDSLNLILCELEESGDHQGLVPSRHCFLISNTFVDVDVGLEMSKENLTRLGSTELSSASSVISVDENNLILNISENIVA